MLYASAINPAIHQVLEQEICLQNIQVLIELPFTELRLLSKALIARLIPVDATSDDKAKLMLLKDDEIDLLISALTSIQSRRTVIPLIPVMMDLGRTPHNLLLFSSRNVTSVLSDVMDDMNEVDQERAAQLIWVMMESNHKGSNKDNVIINSGTTQDLLRLKDGKNPCYTFTHTLLNHCSAWTLMRF